jgi:fibronectin type 3 domain-containing protein
MRTRIYLLATLSAFVMLMGACGTDSTNSVTGVDTVAPNPPVALQVEDDEALVCIRWAENAEIDLAGYRVYKSSYSDGPFHEVTSNLLLCPWYYDGSVLPMATTYYRVTAVDESGNESAYSQVVGVYWNDGGRGDPEEPARE